MIEIDAPRPPRNVLWPYALVALIGGWITAVAWGGVPRHEACWLFIGCTALSGGVLGLCVDRASRHQPLSLVSTGFAVLGAGAINGVLMAMVLGLIIGDALVLLAIPLAALIGVVHGALFLPALLWIAAARRRSLRATSLADGWVQRSVLAATAEGLAASWVVLAVLFRDVARDDATQLVGVIALIIAILGWVADLAVLYRTAQARGHWQRAAPSPTSPDAHLEIFDFGVDEGYRITTEKAPGAYRGHAIPLRAYRGDADVLWRRLRRSLALRGLLVAAVGIAIGVVLALVHKPAITSASVTGSSVMMPWTS